MRDRLLNTALLLLTAFIWGVSFVAQSVGMDYVEPFTFNGLRTTLGGLALLPVIALLERRRPAGERRAVLPMGDRDLWRAGIACGLLLAVGSNLQQVSLLYTGAGKCGFLTAFYVVLVPVISQLFLRRRYPWATWLGVVLAMAGLYFLCLSESFSLAPGDGFALSCALVFALHILVIDRYAPRVDGLRLSCLQFLVAGVLSLLCMALFEHPRLSLIRAAWLPILYSGLLSCGVGYTLQAICQKKVEPALASLALSLESVFSVLAGWAILHERLSGRELLGCALTFAAVLLVELSPLPSRQPKDAEISCKRA